MAFGQSRTLVVWQRIILPDDSSIRIGRYAEAYEAAYGKRGDITDLIPAMLAGFLDSDRAFRNV